MMIEPTRTSGSEMASGGQEAGAEGSSAVLGRRRLIRGGALAAGAATVALVAGTVNAQEAAAADGDAVVVGGSFTGTATTMLSVDSETVAPLGLINSSGPALYLEPLPEDWEGELSPGQVAMGESGPYLGVRAVDGTETTTYLATGEDLASLPVPVAITPVRLLDTRTAAGRRGILRTSAGGLDAQFRVKAGAWIDVAVDSATEDFLLQGAYLNLLSTGSLTGGYLLAYPPGAKPAASTLNFAKAQTIANGSFVALGVVGTAFAVRIYASATTHVVLDLTGATVIETAGPAAPATVRKAARKNNRRRPTQRTRHSIGARHLR